MDKIWLIIKREYSVRVKKRSFIIMTFLIPVLMGGLFLLPMFISDSKEDIKSRAIVEEDYFYFKNLEETETSNFIKVPKNKAETLQEVMSEEETRKDLGMPPELETEDSNKSAIGYFLGFLIYLFIFMYGSMVMRGVLDEKTNRIVEIIISSVKPFQLLIGKIIGIALVGLTQFVLWVVLTIFIGSIAEMSFFGAQAGILDVITMMIQGITKYDLLYFVLYFLGGYLLYSSFFACIGAAVDNESDTHQMVLPITIPLILSLTMIDLVINNPDESMSFWLSICPLSSPIIMMGRIPCGGVESWEILLSLSVLIASFLFSTWISSRIYRIGILMYGKKSSFKELLKWIRYKG